MRVCQRCGKENQAYYKFCLGCGGEIAEETGALATDEQAAAGVSCPHCGHPVTGDSAFCGQCGMRVSPPAGGGAYSEEPSGHLVVIRPDGSEGEEIPLQLGSNLIGREVGAPFSADPYLSPHHAELDLSPGHLLVRDCESLNGVFYRIAGETEIFDGDTFRIGQELLRFTVLPSPEPLVDGTEVMGSPNPGYWGRLAQIVGIGLEGAAYPLSGVEVTLGRERGEIVFSEDGYVSGSHARVTCSEGRFFLSDLNSSNGSYLRIRGELVVSSGTLLLMGQQLFCVRF